MFCSYAFTHFKYKCYTKKNKVLEICYTVICTNTLKGHVCKLSPKQYYFCETDRKTENSPRNGVDEQYGVTYIKQMMIS